MARHRTHSIEFKRQIAQEFVAGESLHALATTSVTAGPMGSPSRKDVV